MSDRASPSFVFIFAAIVALLWMVIELITLSVYDPTFIFLEGLAYLGPYLPLQLLVFMLCLTPLAAVLSRLSLTRIQAGWLGLTLISCLFLITQVGLGVFRSTKVSLWAGIVYIVMVVVICCAIIFVLTWIINRFGRRSMMAATVSGWLGWSLFFVPSMRRGSTELSRGDPEEIEWLHFFSVTEIFLALTVAAVLYIVLRKSSRVSQAPAAIIVALLVFASLPEYVKAQGIQEQPDVLMILIDTMRGDHLGAIRDGASITPNLDQLAASSLYFPHAVAGANMTPSSMPTVFSSLPREVSGFPLRPETTTFPELLYDAGYETFGISANPFVSWAYGYDQGFTALRDPSKTPNFMIIQFLGVVSSMMAATGYDMGFNRSDLYYQPIDSIRKGAIRLIESNERPVLMYLQTMDVHGPYLPPSKYLSAEYRSEDFCSYFDVNTLDNQDVLNSPEMAPCMENIRQRYEAEIRFTDAEIGKLIEDLKAAGRWDEMLVWVFADHGEAFGEKDAMGHSGPYFGQPVINVPMILKLPASMNVPPRAVQVPVSTYDILPTTLSVVGLPEHELAMGRDLSVMFDGVDVPALVFSGGRKRNVVFDWPWKMEANCFYKGCKPDELYNLEKDPEELNNLIGQHPDIQDTLLAAMDARMVYIREIAPEYKAVEIDDATRERLRSLGYVD
jgi:arylsulfatase A-like enzyme